MKREKVMKGDCNSLVASPKKMLADITNLQYPCSKSSNQWENASFVPKDYLSLVKENSMLKKFMAEHQTGRMNIALEKLRRQNSDLARANNVLLTEINSCKDKLKELQHELGCKNGVVLALKQQLEEKRNTVISAFVVAPSNKEEEIKRRIACKASKKINVDDKLCSSKRKKLFKPQTLLASDVLAHEEPESSRKSGTKEQYKGHRSESIPAVLCGAAGTEENEERSNAASRNSLALFDECETSKADTAEETLCVAKKRRASKPLLFKPASEQVCAEERIGNKRHMRRQSTLHKSISGSTAMEATVSEENEEQSLMATSPDTSQPTEKVGNTRLSEGCKSESDPAVPSAFVSERIGERFNGSNMGSKKCSASGNQEDTEGITTASKFGSQESRPSIIGRPSRRAAEKVQSYKEISLKVKMRRPE